MSNLLPMNLMSVQYVQEQFGILRLDHLGLSQYNLNTTEGDEPNQG